MLEKCKFEVKDGMQIEKAGNFEQMAYEMGINLLFGILHVNFRYIATFKCGFEA